MPKLQKPVRPVRSKKLKAAVYNKLRTRMGKRNNKRKGRRFNKREIDKVLGATRTGLDRMDIANNIMRSYGHVL